MVCECVYHGSAQIHTRPRTGTDRKYTEIGAVETLELTQELERQTVANNRTAAGGNCKEYDIVSSVGLNVDVNDWCAKNLALALAGAQSDRAGGTNVANETMVGWPGGIAPFQFIPNTAQAITVESADGATPYALDTDYTIFNGGIIIKTAAEGGTIPAPTPNGVDPTVYDDNIRVSYVDVAQSRIEGLTQLTTELSVKIITENKADNGRPMIFTLHRVSFGPSASMSLISQGPQTFTINPGVLADTSITAVGASQFYYADIQAPTV